jgi:hypothetical protein
MVYGRVSSILMAPKLFGFSSGRKKIKPENSILLYLIQHPVHHFVPSSVSGISNEKDNDGSKEHHNDDCQNDNGVKEDSEFGQNVAGSCGMPPISTLKVETRVS